MAICWKLGWKSQPIIFMAAPFVRVLVLHKLKLTRTSFGAVVVMKSSGVSAANVVEGPLFPQACSRPKLETSSLSTNHYPLSTAFQIPHQPHQPRLVRIVLFPVAEVRNEILPHLARRIFPRIAVEALPIAQHLKRRQPDREQHPLTFLHLAPARLGQLGLHPLARHAVLREDQQQPVMQPNGLIDLFVDLLPTMDVVRRKPAADALGLQVGMQPLGKLLVAGRIADEAGVVLDGPPTVRERSHIRPTRLPAWLSWQYFARQAG